TTTVTLSSGCSSLKAATASFSCARLGTERPSVARLEPSTTTWVPWPSAGIVRQSIIPARGGAPWLRDVDRHPTDRAGTTRVAHAVGERDDAVEVAVGRLVDEAVRAGDTGPADSGRGGDRQRVRHEGGDVVDVVGQHRDPYRMVTFRDRVVGRGGRPRGRSRCSGWRREGGGDGYRTRRRQERGGHKRGGRAGCCQRPPSRRHDDARARRCRGWCRGRHGAGTGRDAAERERTADVRSGRGYDRGRGDGGQLDGGHRDRPGDGDAGEGPGA